MSYFVANINASSSPTNLGTLYASSQTGNGSLTYNSIDKTYTVIPKSPAYVVGEYVIAPLIQKVSKCFARFNAWFQSTSFIQFPLAEAAVPPKRREIEFLQRVANQMSNYQEFSDAHKKMKNLIERGKATKRGKQSLGEEAFTILMDLFSVATKPAIFIVDNFIEGIRQGQLNIALEKIEQLQRQRKQQMSQINKFYADRNTRKEINKLRDQKKRIQAQIDQLETEIDANGSTMNGLVDNYRSKIREFNNKVDNYNKLLRDYKRDQQLYSTRIASGRISYKESLQTNDMLEKRRKHLQTLDKETDRLKESCSGLETYYNTIREHRDKLLMKREPLMNTRNNLDSQITTLQQRLKKDEL